MTPGKPTIILYVQAQMMASLLVTCTRQQCQGWLRQSCLQKKAQSSGQHLGRVGSAYLVRCSRSPVRSFKPEVKAEVAVRVIRLVR